jgi:hypothetical protein
VAFYTDKEQRFRQMAGAECLCVCVHLLDQALDWRLAAAFACVKAARRCAGVLLCDS